MTPDEHIAELEAENARQREQIAALVARVQELEARLADLELRLNERSASRQQPPQPPMPYCCSITIARRDSSRNRSPPRAAGSSAPCGSITTTIAIWI